MNIVEHSSEKRGVITCRFYDNKRLFELKSESEKEYLLEIADDFFLDINVIDFGEISLRQTYINNLVKNENIFQNYLGNTFEDDRKIIEEQYAYEDFFVINFNKFINLEHQQNKLISRYGLHYFTNIIKETYHGFIKTSSIKEGVFFYKRNDNTDCKRKFEEFVNHGTVFNCIIPLNKYSKKVTFNEDYVLYPKKETLSINTFLELDKFKMTAVQ